MRGIYQQTKQSPTRKSKNKKCLLKYNEAANEYLSDKKTINAGQIANKASKPANQQTKHDHAKNNIIYL